jgi:hypothetical protein
VCIPTALKGHVSEQLRKWVNKGYRIALFVDPGPVDLEEIPVGLLIMANYPGVWRAWNALAKAVMACGADVCVLAGDDMDPDPKLDAQDIAERYFSHFERGQGVYQPTGDNQGELIGGKWNSQRICGSPWVGREWCERAYLGKGPVDGRFWAFYADELMKEVAEQHDLLVQDDEVQQWHRHWSWPKNGLPKQPYHDRNQKEWFKDKEIFLASKAAGFPEAEFLGRY